MDPYVVIKFIHVLAAIVAVGFNASYGIWIALTSRSPEHRLYILRGIKFLDDRFANPAYVLLLVSGVALLGFGGIAPTTPWVAASLVLYAVLVVIGLGFYSPALGRQIAELESSGPTSSAYPGIARRTTSIGASLALIAVVIVLLMVTKPTL